MATQQDEFLINFFQVVVCHCVLSHLVALIRKSPAQGRAFLLGKYLEMGRREDKKGGMPSPAPVHADTHLQLTGGIWDQWMERAFCVFIASACTQSRSRSASLVAQIGRAAGRGRGEMSGG